LEFGIPELDRLAEMTGAKVVLLYGEAGSGRSTLALTACARSVRGALYMCGGVPVIREGTLGREGEERVMVGTFSTLAEVQEAVKEFRPALTVVDPVNGWCGGICGARQLGLTLFSLCESLGTGAELILVGDVVYVKRGYRPRYFGTLARFCDLCIDLKKGAVSSGRPKTLSRTLGRSWVLGCAP